MSHRFTPPACEIRQQDTRCYLQAAAFQSDRNGSAYLLVLLITNTASVAPFFYKVERRMARTRIWTASNDSSSRKGDLFTFKSPNLAAGYRSTSTFREHGARNAGTRGRRAVKTRGNWPRRPGKEYVRISTPSLWTGFLHDARITHLLNMANRP